jgi:hypothetical protein
MPDLEHDVEWSGLEWNRVIDWKTNSDTADKEILE